MKLKWVSIKNYRSCKDIELSFNSMHALVGANNAGKSSILRALDFLLNPSIAKIDEESFWNGDSSLQIWVEAIFDDLTEQEIDVLQAYLRPDKTFHMARSAKITDNQEDDESQEQATQKVIISQHYCKPMPTIPWLQTANINNNNINEWWQDKNRLIINDKNFLELVGERRPTVTLWKEKAEEFTRKYLTEKDFENVWAENPKGYAGVLKGILPQFMYIPAVRDISEEAKVTKKNPFGRLLYGIINGITEEQTEEISGFLGNIEKRLNRTGGEERLASIIQTEKKLNKFLNDYMPGELEIEFQPPTIEILLMTPKLFANDGFRNTIENKGHGLQRATIFAILRCYSELVTSLGDKKARTTIFAIEEPEIYMHPQAQRTIRRVFQDISNKGDQVIFATHSSLLVDVAYFDEIIRVESVQKEYDNVKTVESNVWQLPMTKMIEDFETRHPRLKGKATDHSMRELYAHAYHPTRSEGFFAKKIILVEGATEGYSLPIYAEALGYAFDLLNISVVDCGSKGQMDRLYRIFNELRIPCYILFDYDQASSDKKIIEKSKELLTMLGEKPDAPDKIFVKDGIACFPNKWEQDIAAEIPGIEDLTAEARKFLGLSDDCGKPLVARYIAKKLTSQKPKIIPPSIKQIIEKAIVVEWKQSCLHL